MLRISGSALYTFLLQVSWPLYDMIVPTCYQPTSMYKYNFEKIMSQDFMDTL